jgi:O-antigen/teichoic acid export membrane protein
MPPAVAAFLNHGGFKKYVHHLSWMLTARIFTMGVSFLAMIIIARALGPSNFGELDYVLAIISILSIIANFGTMELLYRGLIQYPERSGAFLGTALGLRFVMGILAQIMVVLFAYVSPIDTISRTLLLILSLTLPLGTLALLGQIFMAEARSKIPSIITMVGWTVAALAKILVIALGKGVIWIALTYILEHTLYGVLYVVCYRALARTRALTLSFDRHLVPQFLKTGSAILLASVFTIIYARIDQVFIRHFLDATSVGFYSAGVRLVEVANIVPTLLVIGLYPAVLGIRIASEDEYKRRTRAQFVLLAVSGSLITIACLLLAHPLIALIFGNAFLAGVPAFRIYALSIPFIFIGAQIINILYTEDLRKSLIATTGIPAGINILLNIFWIPAYGIIGASWATLISFASVIVVAFWGSRSRATLMDALYVRYGTAPERAPEG